MRAEFDLPHVSPHSDECTVGVTVSKHADGGHLILVYARRKRNSLRTMMTYVTSDVPRRRVSLVRRAGGRRSVMERIAFRAQLRRAKELAADQKMKEALSDVVAFQSEERECLASLLSLCSKQSTTAALPPDVCSLICTHLERAEEASAWEKTGKVLLPSW